MREHLDTMPVWEAVRADSECPMCHILEKSEAQYVDNFLGGSVMEPAVRIEVNQKGFCGRHFKMLYDARNRLGLALMEHTYLMECIKKLESSKPRARKPLGRPEPHPERGMADTCILCDRLSEAMGRYARTFCHMWKTETAFRRALLDSKGFCIPHFLELMDAAQRELSGAALGEFIELISRVELDNLRRIEKDIEWFTLKFDYRNQDKPWGTSEDAVERTINKLRGKTV